MLIGEIASKTGFSRDTIRFYEKQGLLAIGKKSRRENNYKEYSEASLDRLLSIKRMKSFGFTLNEIADLIDVIEENEATCDNVSVMIDRKVQVIDAKILQMIELRNQLLSSANKCIACCSPSSQQDNCPMLTKSSGLLITV